jgi:hypothetical protein
LDDGPLTGGEEEADGGGGGDGGDGSKKGPPVTVLSSSSILERRVSVTSDRKHELLMKARHDRTDWISRVPAPFRRRGRGSRTAGAAAASQEEDNDGGGSQEPAAWSQELARTHAAQLLPASLDLLSHLYGVPPATPAPAGRSSQAGGDEGAVVAAAERISSLLEKAKSGSSADSGSALVPASDQMQLELASSALDAAEASYLKSYRSLFFQPLLDPAGAVAVQGMRNFCRKIVSVRDPQELARRLESYIASTWDAALSSRTGRRPPAPSRRGAYGTASSADGADTDSEAIRCRSFEAFIYGQCYSHLKSVLWTADAAQRDEQWRTRLGELQFVTPRHLEIHCLSGQSEEGAGDSSGIDLDELLKDAMDALASIDAYYSPRDKLQRILAAYHRVNAALSRALNPPGSSSSAPSKRLPSADDVLPTIILCVLRSQPRRLLWNLQFVEQLSSPEALRGEAGYAFTNLYGAAQFLLDLDLDVREDGGGGPSGLSMSAEEFRRGLASCRETASERLERAASAPASSRRPGEREDDFAPSASAEEIDLSPLEVRAARGRGEVVDVEWALRLKDEQPNGTPDRARGPSAATPSDEAGEDLPPGFARTYTFLTARPEDVRLSDLPRLLDEYRMLVHTTEALLGERSARARAERKAKRRAAERELYGRVRDADPSLLQLRTRGAATTAAGAAAAAAKASYATLNGTR